MNRSKISTKRTCVLIIACMMGIHVFASNGQTGDLESTSKECAEYWFDLTKATHEGKPDAMGIISDIAQRTIEAGFATWLASRDEEITTRECMNAINIARRNDDYTGRTIPKKCKAGGRPKFDPISKYLDEFGDGARNKSCRNAGDEIIKRLEEARKQKEEAMKIDWAEVQQGLDRIGDDAAKSGLNRWEDYERNAHVQLGGGSIQGASNTFDQNLSAANRQLEDVIKYAPPINSLTNAQLPAKRRVNPSLPSAGSNVGGPGTAGPSTNRPRRGTYDPCYGVPKGMCAIR